MTSPRKTGKNAKHSTRSTRVMLTGLGSAVALLFAFAAAEPLLGGGEGTGGVHGDSVRENSADVSSLERPAASQPASGEVTPSHVNEAKVLKASTKIPDLNKAAPVPVATDVKSRKSQFIGFLLPAVERANEKLTAKRRAIIRAIEIRDMRGLENWAKQYGVDAEKFASLDALGDELLKRVAPVPVSITLAQAAVESGWGTSRFAIEGNNYFGQRTTSQWENLVASGAKVYLRKFPSHQESVRSYMYTLNSHYAYEEFRQVRNRLGVADTGSMDIDEINALVDTLVNYSERREEYTSDVKQIIKYNKLDRYDGNLRG